MVPTSKASTKQPQPGSAKEVSRVADETQSEESKKGGDDGSNCSAIGWATCTTMQRKDFLKTMATTRSNKAWMMNSRQSKERTSHKCNREEWTIGARLTNGNPSAAPL